MTHPRREAESLRRYLLLERALAVPFGLFALVVSAWGAFMGWFAAAMMLVPPGFNIGREGPTSPGEAGWSPTLGDLLAAGLVGGVIVLVAALVASVGLVLLRHSALGTGVRWSWRVLPLSGAVAVGLGALFLWVA